MQENDAKKKYNQIENRVQDYHYLDEASVYNPFGKGGGGAPLRD